MGASGDFAYKSIAGVLSRAKHYDWWQLLNILRCKIVLSIFIGSRCSFQSKLINRLPLANVVAMEIAYGSMSSKQLLVRLTLPPSLTPSPTLPTSLPPSSGRYRFSGHHQHRRSVSQYLQDVPQGTYDLRLGRVQRGHPLPLRRPTWVTLHPTQCGKLWQALNCFVLADFRGHISDEGRLQWWYEFVCCVYSSWVSSSSLTPLSFLLSPSFSLPPPPLLLLLSALLLSMTWPLSEI